ADLLDTLIHPCIEPAIKIAGSKLRSDHITDYAVGDGIRQCPFESVAHLDANSAIVLRHQQQCAVVDFFAAELPLVDYADGILLDLLRMCGRNDQHRDLATLARLACTYLLSEPRNLIPRTVP